MIKTIIFDFGDVLVTDTAKSYRKKYVNKLPRSRQATCRKIFDLDDRGKFSLKQLCDTLSELITPQLLPKDIFKEIMSYKLLSRTWHLANRLQKRYKIIILSNAGKYNPEVIRKKLKISLDKFFFICSAKVGMRKPNSDIYEYVIKKFKLNPKEIVFIDDSRPNLSPAKRLGMHTYLYDQNYSKLIAYLKKIGIQI